MLWRSTILHPLVERIKIGSVLEMLEHSSSQLATASRVFSVLGTGIGKTLAGLIVFVISAALHELIASGALQELRVWIFMGMLLQLPAIMLTSYLDKKIFKGSELGNVLFWFFFCIVGQPMILMLYYADLAL